MTAKRSRDEADEVEKLAMANCLMLLSKVGENNDNNNVNEKAFKDGRVFECKTCKKQFHSFQALGGHRASHKKMKLMATDFLLQSQLNSLVKKPKTHECSICGLEFSLGQALGGHMRRHRSAAIAEEPAKPAIIKMVPVLKRSNSKRIFGFDLNLIPYENDFQLLKIAPPASAMN